MCRQKLACGHECPSGICFLLSVPLADRCSRTYILCLVCGEPCDEQACILCLPDERKVDIVDFIMQRKLAEIDLSSEDPSERLIRLACGHIFTVETLDGHCKMSEYYEIDPMGVLRNRPHGRLHCHESAPGELSEPPLLSHLSWAYHRSQIRSGYEAGQSGYPGTERSKYDVIGTGEDKPTN